MLVLLFNADMSNLGKGGDNSYSENKVKGGSL
jgi:hypothetical protein